MSRRGSKREKRKKKREWSGVEVVHTAVTTERTNRLSERGTQRGWEGEGDVKGREGNHINNGKGKNIDRQAGMQQSNSTD